MGPIDLKCNQKVIFLTENLFFQTKMNLIFIYLIVQSHAISPFATFGKFFSNIRVRGKKPSRFQNQGHWWRNLTEPS